MRTSYLQLASRALSESLGGIGMGKWARDEIEGAFRHYEEVVEKCGRSVDWDAYADLFTEDAEYYDEMYDLIGKYMSKINRFAKTRIFTLHVVQYHDKSFVKEYEMRARLSTDKQMFYAQSEGWNLIKALDDVLEAFERMVTKEKERRVDAIKKRNH